MNDRFSNIHMSELLKDEPIEVCSLTLYPITMENYQIFRACRPALLLRLGTLPAVYAVKPYISALYALEMDSINNSGSAIGLLRQMMTLACLAMRLPVEYAGELIRFLVDKDDPSKLMKISIKQGDVMVQLTPGQFNKIRETIAIQNGEELPDEAENPELVEALNEKARQASPQLDENEFDLIASVAYKSGVRAKDVLSWTIREFEYRKRAIDRDISHLISGIVEANGMKYKNGNPAPSWCYDRQKSLLGAFRSEDDLLRELGKVGDIRT